MSAVPAFRKITRLPEFDRDLKRLVRRFRTLEEDLATLMKAQLVLFHMLGIDNGGVIEIPGMPFSAPKIYKAKKFACRSLKGRGVHSGLRLIYAFFEGADRIELIEMYFKGDKENEDRERILKSYEECPRQ